MPLGIAHSPEGKFLRHILQVLLHEGSGGSVKITPLDAHTILVEFPDSAIDAQTAYGVPEDGTLLDSLFETIATDFVKQLSYQHLGAVSDNKVLLSDAGLETSHIFSTDQAEKEDDDDLPF